MLLVCLYAAVAFRFTSLIIVAVFGVVSSASVFSKCALSASNEVSIGSVLAVECGVRVGQLTNLAVERSNLFNDNIIPKEPVGNGSVFQVRQNTVHYFHALLSSRPFSQSTKKFKSTRSSSRPIYHGIRPAVKGY